MNHLSFHDYASKQIALKQMQDISPINLMFRKREVEEVEPKKQVQVNLSLPYFENPEGFESTIHETMSLIEEMYRDFVDIHLTYIGLNVEDFVKPIEFNKDSAYDLLYSEVEHHLTYLYDYLEEVQSREDGVGVVTRYEIDIPRLATMITNHGEPSLLSNVFFYVWFNGRGDIRGDDLIPSIEWFLHFKKKITDESWCGVTSLNDATTELLYRLNEELTEFNFAITNPTVSIETAIIRLVEKGFFKSFNETNSEQDSHIPTEPDDVPWEVEEVA